MEDKDIRMSQQSEMHKCEASWSIWTKAHITALHVPQPQGHEVSRNIAPPNDFYYNDLLRSF